MPMLKNARRETFAQLVSKGMKVGKAYVEAGYVESQGNPAKLKAVPAVAARIRELQAAAADHAKLNRAWVLEGLMNNAIRCMGDGEERNPTAANRAYELLGKEIGMFVDRRLLGVRRIEDMSEEELLEFLGGEPDAEELGQAAGSPPIGHA